MLFLTWIAEQSLTGSSLVGPRLAQADYISYWLTKLNKSITSYRFVYPNIIIISNYLKQKKKKNEMKQEPCSHLSHAAIWARSSRRGEEESVEQISA